MSTPTNTNPAILGDMIDQIGGGGSSSDKMLLYEGEITTEQTYSSMGGVAYSASIPAKAVIGPYEVQNVYITFEGNSYILPKSSQPVTTGQCYYGTDERYNSGHPSFSEPTYPCGIVNGYQSLVCDALYTAQPGTYSIKIEV